MDSFKCTTVVSVESVTTFVFGGVFVKYAKRRGK